MKVEDEKLKELLLSAGVRCRVVWVKSEPSEQQIELRVENGILFAIALQRDSIHRRDIIDYTKANYPELWI